jgi:NADPH:quinone reductase-like Zn-dependent oxidoreductase
MKSYHVNSGAGLAGLTLKEHEEPRPGPREVLVRVRAVSLNFRELMILRGIARKARCGAGLRRGR